MPSKSVRHFEDEEFPDHCDHCPAAFGPGVVYRRVQLVIDSGDSVVGGSRVGVEHSFELVLCSACAQRLHGWVLTPLSEVPPDGEPPAELDEGELEEQLEKELFILGDGEEEGTRSSASEGLTATGYRLQATGSDPDPDLSELKPGPPEPSEAMGWPEPETRNLKPHLPIEPDVSKWRNVSGVSIFPTQEEGRIARGESTCTTHPRGDDPVCYSCYLQRLSGAITTAVRKSSVCTDPNKMHGAADQFPGSDYEDPP